MKKFFLIAVIASLFSITAQAAERPANYYRPYGHNTRYTRTSESRSSQNYQRQQYRQPSYYPQEVQHQPAPDYRYQQSAPSFYDTIQIRPVIGIDYVYSTLDVDDTDDYFGDTPDQFLKDKLNAYAFSAGFKINQYFGLEAFYQQSDKGKKKYEGDTIEDQYKAYGLDFIGYLPLMPNLDFIGSLGVAYYKAEYKLSWEGFDGNESESGSEEKYGIRIGAGLQYYFTNNIAFRFMARLNDTNFRYAGSIIDLSAGLRFYF